MLAKEIRLLVMAVVLKVVALKARVSMGFIIIVDYNDGITDDANNDGDLNGRLNVTFNQCSLSGLFILIEWRTLWIGKWVGMRADGYRG